MNETREEICTAIYSNNSQRLGYICDHIIHQCVDNAINVLNFRVRESSEKLEIVSDGGESFSEYAERKGGLAEHVYKILSR